MAQGREDITAVIEMLNVGDRVKVEWTKSGNVITCEGLVWDPGDSELLGLGPELLDPNDLQLTAITILKRVPLTPPPVGSVAVFRVEKQDGSIAYHAAKRNATSWSWTGSQPVLVTASWDAIVFALGGLPVAVFDPTATT